MYFLVAFMFVFQTTTLKAQTFTAQTGANNPLNGQDVGSESTPSFGDFDGDGDFDLIAGEGNGNFNYFENTGTISVPVFTQRTGGSNPMNGYDVGDRSTPAVIDIDNDGDYDIFAGETSGNFNYFENTGSSTSPVFTERTGASNPLNGFNVGGTGIGAGLSSPKFADLDDDGDYDMMSGRGVGSYYYYENTGSASSPSFTQRTGAANPMNGFDVGYTARPTFVDVDRDGDWDIFAGEYDGNINYYENTGDSTSPVYTQRTGGANPFNGVDVGTRSSPTFVDLTNDGNSDAMVGETVGNFNYYTGNNIGGTPLPIELSSFDVNMSGDIVLVGWTTSSEINNERFNIERSRSLENFVSIGEVKGAGNSREELDYTFIDAFPLAGISYYRLKQTDFDGKYSYSEIRAVGFDSESSELRVFPNPTKGNALFVELPEGATDIASFDVMDVNGKSVFRKTVAINADNTGIHEITLTELTGLYFLIVRSKTQVWTRKIILE